MRYTFIYKSLTLSLIFCTGLFAQTTQLSLDDLKLPENKNYLEIEVSSASKYLEDLRNAPGVISVVTSDEIEKFGANNLFELIERVASTYPIGSFYLPQNYISIRGDLHAEYNNHVLILINGRPSRENLLGGIDYPLFYSFPIGLIDRIEVIRGPGSVLYGSNAYTGLVNIITKEIEKDFTSINAGYGSFGTASFEFNNSVIKDEVNIKSGITYFNQKGWEFQNIGEDIPLPDNSIIPGDTLIQDMYKNNIGGMMSIEYKNLTFNSLIAYSGVNHHGVLPVGTYPGPFKITQNRAIESLRAFLDIGYDFKFSEQFHMTLNTTYNSLFSRFKTPAGDAVINTKDLIIEPTAFYSNNKIELLLGATAYLQEGKAETGDDFNRGVAFYSEVWYSAYSQIKYSPFSFLSLVAGGQLNKPAGISTDFVPRVGAIITPIKNTGIKLLYGQAFRAPFEAEQSLYDLPILIGAENLEPEKVATFDFQVFYNSKILYLAASYFHSKQRDLITRSTVTANIDEPGYPSEIMISSFENKNQLVLEGLEIEGKIIPSNKTFIRSSITYQTNVLNNEIKQASLAPEVVLKLGGYYSSNGFSVGLFDSWYSKAGKAKFAAEKNPEAKAFHFLTLNLKFDFLRLLKKEKKNYSIVLNLYSTNLLDNDIRYPEYARRNINTIPGRGGRAIYSQLRLKF